jgi:hypothetical protein
MALLGPGSTLKRASRPRSRQKADCSLEVRSSSAVKVTSAATAATAAPSQKTVLSLATTASL